MMKNKIVLFIPLFFFIALTQCKKIEKQPILLADREAPLGWVYLRIYADSTFEFESRGLERKGDIYSGNVKIKDDTLLFNYSDSIPRAGKTALFNFSNVAYIDGQYPESMPITLNKISNK